MIEKLKRGIGYHDSFLCSDGFGKVEVFMEDIRGFRSCFLLWKRCLDVV